MAFKASTSRRGKSRRTAAQSAASKRNLEKARAARKSRSNQQKYGHLAPGTYLIKNDGETLKIAPKSRESKTNIAPPKVLTGKTIRKSLPGPTIKYHPYTGKPYDLRNIKGGKEIPLIGLRGANAWLKANTIRRRRRK